jgi:hypothetical protein
VRRRVQEGSKKAVDKQEPSHRPQSSRVLSTRAARQRRTPSHNRGVSPEQRQFQQACAAWSVKLGVKLNALFNLMPQFGKSVHWARERYYGGTFVTDADLYWVNARVNDESEIEHSGKLQRYAAAVDLMCRVCAGDEEKTPTCWDGTCPLRPVSPLPLRIYK